MSYSVRLLRDFDPDWNTWVSKCRHDFYHRSEYHRLWSGPGTPYLAIYGDADRFVAWPYILFPLNQCEGLENCCLNDVTSVYGYAGPVASRVAPGDPFVQVACLAFADLWRSQDVVSAFTCFHPLLRNHRLLEGVTALDRAAADRALTVRGHTVSIDLTAGEDAIWHEYRRSNRQQLRCGWDLGLTSAPDPEWMGLTAFVDLLRATMDRNHAEPRYYLSTLFFQRFRELFSDGLFLHVTRHDGRIVSGMVYLEYRKTAHALYGATAEEYIHKYAYKVCIDAGRRWAQQRGNEILHLGGGRGCHDDDTLFYFKTAFSRRRHEFVSGEWLLQKAAYLELWKQKAAYLRSRGLSSPKHEFFPVYRASAETYRVPDETTTTSNGSTSRETGGGGR